MPAQMSSDDEVQFVLGDGQGRQVIVAVVTPYKPDERSVWRRHDRVSPNAAISAVELHDGVVRMRRSGGHETERQCANCNHSRIWPEQIELFVFRAFF